MKNILAVVITLCLFSMTGCSSKPQEINYYKLANNYWPSTVSLKKNNPAHTIYIDNIDVATFLNKNGIVLQTDAIKYNIAANNLWVIPIYQQLNELMLRDFSNLLPHYVITNHVDETPYATVKLVIDGFHGTYNGEAVIKGRWEVIKNGEHFTKIIDRKLSLKNPGYDALVSALSLGWLDEEMDFVKQLAF